jgi:carbon-monoxide dehydrogenase medium subunit
MGAGATLLAGGTVLVPAISNGQELEAIADLGGLAGLRVMEQRDDGLRIGALVTLDRLVASVELASGSNPMAALRDAALAVGNPNVRRLATVGGNVALAKATGDVHPALLVLDGRIGIRGRDGDDAELSASVLSDGGIPPATLVRYVRIPGSPAGRSAFVKFAWRASSAITVVAVAISLELDRGRVRSPRLAASGLRARVARLSRAEECLTDVPLDDANVEAACAAGSAELPFESPPLPGMPGERYRRALVAEGLRRLLTKVARS